MIRLVLTVKVPEEFNRIAYETLNGEWVEEKDFDMQSEKIKIMADNDLTEQEINNVGYERKR